MPISRKQAQIEHKDWVEALYRLITVQIDDRLRQFLNHKLIYVNIPESTPAYGVEYVNANRAEIIKRLLKDYRKVGWNVNPATGPYEQHLIIFTV